MPIKIVSTPSNQEKGEVNIGSLNGMISEYQNSVTVHGAEKTFSFYFDKQEVKKMLDQSADGVRIKLTVHNSDQHLACDQKNYNEYLGVAIFSVNSGKIMDAVGDFVLIPGYKKFGHPLAGDCCGTMNPPGQG